MATVHLIDVTKQFGNNVVLDQLNLKIDEGEFVAVVGPSGCGKSTLLRLVSGLDTVSSGSVLIGEKCVNTIPPAKRDMAMVFQNYALYPHMTVFDNMAYGLKRRGLSKAMINTRVNEVAALLQLQQYLYRKPLALSGGQRQRVAMGRAIVRSPAVFLFDEPLSNLDFKLRMEMRHEIQKLHQHLKTTCLYVTHDQTEAMTMADRVVILNKGQIEQIGTPREVYQYPATKFVASFIGHYPMNFFSGTVDVQNHSIVTCFGITLPFLSFINALVASEEVLIGIRPEDIILSTSNTPGSIAARVLFIDDLGADQLLQVKTCTGDVMLYLRVPGNLEIASEEISLVLDVAKMSFFSKQTGVAFRVRSSPQAAGEAR